MQDVDLITLVQEYQRTGDDALLRKILKGVNSLLFLCLLEVGCPSSDLPDRVQEAEIAIWESLPNFRGNSSAEFLKWCTQIVRYKYIDELRRRGKEMTLTVPMEMVSEAVARVVESKGPRRKQSDDLQFAIHCLQQMPVPERDYVFFHYHDGLSWKEIGEMFGKTEDAVKQAALRALAVLRKPDRKDWQQ